MGVPSDKYVAAAMLSSIIIGVFGGFLGYLILGVVLDLELPFTLFYVTEGSSQAWAVANKELLLTLGVVPLFILLFAQISYRLFLYYPSFSASVRKGQIDATVPYAITFMYAMSKGGVNIIDIFKSLREYSNVYGEVGNEAGMIIRDTEYFGHDITTALHNVSDITPSDKFKNFLEGLISTIDSGSNITSYLSAKSQQFQKEAAQEQKNFLETLAIIAEVYVTAFIAFPLFLITIIVVMGMMSGGYLTVLQLIIYFVIPLGSMVFVILLSSMSGKSAEHRAFFTTSKRLDVFKDVPTAETKSSESHLFSAFERHDKRQKLIEFLKNPLRAIFEEPSLALYISVPAGVIYFIVMLYHLMGINPITIDILDNHIVIALFISLTPFAFFYEVRERKIKKIEDAIPDFLTGLASIQEAGLTLARALKLILASNLGILTSEVRKMWGEIQWGSTTTTAFIRFEKRIRTGSISRTVSLITKASEVSGDIRDVLTIAARDATTAKTLRDERRINMFMYVIVVYISFAVFLFIVLILSTMFLPRVPTDIGVTSNAAGFFAQDFDIETYKELFFHSVVIQGFCSGLIAGQMGEGQTLSGLKHSLIMVAIAYFVFVFL